MWTPSAYPSWETPGPVFLCSTLLCLFRVPQTEGSLGGNPVRPAALYSEEEAEVQRGASGSARGEAEPPAVCLICQLELPRSAEGSQLALGALQTPPGGEDPGMLLVGRSSWSFSPVLQGMAAETLALHISLPNSSCCVSASPRESLAPQGPLAGKGHQEKT